ncbi:MAG TPA: hypothetical protein VF164_01305 [Trueperaceae bacterium]
MASLLTAIAAWTCLGAVGGSPLALYLSHDVLGRADVAVPVAVIGYSVGWLLMVAAMMLPVSLLLPGPLGRGTTWYAGYLGAWLLTGFVFAWFDLVLHTVLGAAGPGEHVALRAVLGATGGGLSLVIAWKGTAHPPRTDAKGWLHGLECVRTCGPLMLALQAAAPGSLPAMAGAAALLAAARLRHLRSEFASVAT